MVAKPTQTLRLDAKMVSGLACPACFGDLSQGDAGLVCAACGRTYPIVDGIPVLIVERAETADKPD